MKTSSLLIILLAVLLFVGILYFDSEPETQEQEYCLVEGTNYIEPCN